MNQAAPTVTVPPALVVIAGGAGDTGWPAAAASPDVKLLKALPPAQRVLEVGPGSRALARAYKQRQPGAEWKTATLSGPTKSTSREAVDRWCALTGLADLPAGRGREVGDHAVERRDQGVLHLHRLQG